MSTHEEIEALEDFLAIRCGEPVGKLKFSRAAPSAADPINRLRVNGVSLTDLRGFSWSFLYEGGSQRERRTVRFASGFWRNDIVYLNGYCFSAEGARQFRAERISDAYDSKTGEIVDDPVAFMASLITAPRTDGLIQLLDIGRDCLYVLCAVAASDGKVYPDEIEAILAFSSQLADDQGIALSEHDVGRLSKVVAMYRPTPRSVVRALARIAQDGRFTVPLVRALKDLVHRDNVFSYDEQKVIERFAVALSFFRCNNDFPPADFWESGKEFWSDEIVEP